MAKHITKWRPDTCGCEISYEWDDSVSEEQRVHKEISSKKCAAHAAASSAQETCLDENRRKNEALGEIWNDNDFGTDQEDEHGNIHRVEHPKRKCKWHFDESRKLVIELPAIPAAPGVNLRSARSRAFVSKLVDKFGSNKIEIK